MWTQAKASTSVHTEMTVNVIRNDKPARKRTEQNLQIPQYLKRLSSTVTGLSVNKEENGTQPANTTVFETDFINYDWTQCLSKEKNRTQPANTTVFETAFINCDWAQCLNKEENRTQPANTTVFEMAFINCEWAHCLNREENGTQTANTTVFETAFINYDWTQCLNYYQTKCELWHQHMSTQKNVCYY